MRLGEFGVDLERSAEVCQRVIDPTELQQPKPKVVCVSTNPGSNSSARR